MGVQETVREFMEKESGESFGYKDKRAIAERLGLRESTVGWALWNLARKGIIDKRAEGNDTLFQGRR